MIKRHFTAMSTREWAMIALLFAICVVTRLWDLGAKPVMHDEGLFLYYTEYHLVREFNYRYQPILHGPLHLWWQGFLFWLLGSSDATMRLGSAILGIGAFGWIVAMRPWLGRIGTPIALAFYTLSPGLMYYGRFFREDGVFLFVEFWIIASLAWWWRTQSKGWLASLVFACAVLFCNKESSLFVYFILLTFAVLALMQDLLERDSHKSPSAHSPTAPIPSVPLVAGFIIVGATLVQTQIVEGIRFDADVVSELGHDFVMKDVRSLPLALGWHSPVEGVGMAGRPWFWRVFYLLLIGGAVAFAYGLRIAVQRRLGGQGLLSDLWSRFWTGRFAIIASLSAGIALFIILFTTFLQYPESPFSLYHRTLAYWMGQHAIHRIYGPFHQHMLNLAVYELPGLLVLVIGLILLMTRGQWNRTTAIALLLCAAPFLALHVVIAHGIPSPPMWFLAMAMLTLAAGVAAYLYPTLGGRIALALTLLMVLLAISWFSSDSWSRFLLEPIPAEDGGFLAMSGREVLDDRLSLTSGFHLAIIALLILIATVVTWRSLQRGDRMQALLVWYFVVMLGAASYAREKVPQVGVHAAVPLVLLVGIYSEHVWRSSTVQHHKLPRLGLLGLLGISLVWQTRAAVHLCFVNVGDVRERYVYGETTADVKHHAAMILRYRDVASIRHQHRPGSSRPEWIEGYNDPRTLKSVRVQMADFDIVWPLRWYLRDVDYRVSGDVEAAMQDRIEFLFLPLGDETIPGLADEYHLYRGRLRMHWVPEPLGVDRLLGGWRVTVPTHNASSPRDRAADQLAGREWARIRDYLLWREVTYDRDPGLSYVEYIFAVRKDLGPF
jgi:predicted membrane-bound mannosyltransferase